MTLTGHRRKDDDPSRMPYAMDANQRDNWLAADDDALLAGCEIDTYRASGPGGQKRNKTSSAVRLRHKPSGLMVIAEESRSQHENKARALRRLRRAIALAVRRPVGSDWHVPPLVRGYLTASGQINISRKNPDYPAVAATLLDVIAAFQGRIRDAAAQFGISTAQLSRFITEDGKLLAAVNEFRRAAGARPLTH